LDTLHAFRKRVKGYICIDSTSHLPSPKVYLCAEPTSQYPSGGPARTDTQEQVCLYDKELIDLGRTAMCAETNKDLEKPTAQVSENLDDKKIAAVQLDDAGD
jgi:hypothetical protein